MNLLSQHAGMLQPPSPRTSDYGLVGAASNRLGESVADVVAPWRHSLFLPLKAPMIKNTSIYTSMARIWQVFRSVNLGCADFATICFSSIFSKCAFCAKFWPRIRTIAEGVKNTCQPRMALPLKQISCQMRSDCPSPSRPLPGEGAGRRLLSNPRPGSTARDRHGCASPAGRLLDKTCPCIPLFCPSHGEPLAATRRFMA